MNDADRLTDYLVRAFGKAYCDDCLASELDMPPAAVQDKTRSLAEESWTTRSDGICTICGSTKPVIRRRVSAFAS